LKGLSRDRGTNGLRVCGSERLAFVVEFPHRWCDRGKAACGYSSKGSKGAQDCWSAIVAYDNARQQHQNVGRWKWGDMIEKWWSRGANSPDPWVGRFGAGGNMLRHSGDGARASMTFAGCWRGDYGSRCAESASRGVRLGVRVDRPPVSL